MPMYNLTGQQGVYGFILKMKQLILMQILPTLMILNLSGIRLNYNEIQLQMEQTELKKVQQWLSH